MKATAATAALAGALASAGFLLCRIVQARLGPFSPPAHAADWTAVAALAAQVAYWAAAAAAVALLPGWFLVVGAGQRAFEKRWFKDPDEAHRFMSILNRMVVWFLAATATTLVLSRL